MIYFIFSHCKTVLFLISFLKKLFFSFEKIIFFKWFFRQRRSFCRAICFGELGNRKQNSFTPPCSFKDNRSLLKSKEVLALCLGATEVARGPVSSSKKSNTRSFSRTPQLQAFRLTRSGLVLPSAGTTRLLRPPSAMRTRTGVNPNLRSMIYP